MNEPSELRRDFPRNLPLFGGVSLEACAQLAQAIKPFEIDDGSAVYQAGETGDSLCTSSSRVRSRSSRDKSCSTSCHQAPIWATSSSSIWRRAASPCAPWGLARSGVSPIKPLTSFDDKT